MSFVSFVGFVVQSFIRAAARNASRYPTTAQWTARLEDGGWVLEKMRWGLIPFWRGGKPVKDTAKGAGAGFKLTTFNCRTETAQTAATFKGAHARRRCILPAGAWYEWTDEQGGTTGSLASCSLAPARPWTSGSIMRRCRRYYLSRSGIRCLKSTIVAMTAQLIA